MNCAEYKQLFSLYLDGQVSGAEMYALTKHMESCPDCTTEYSELRRTQEMLMALRKTKAPADLSLRLRVAISREAAQAKRSRFEGMLVRFTNALDAIMFPATAGVIAAVLIFGFLLGVFAMPRLEASTSDVPLMLYIGPKLEHSAFGTTLGSMGDDSLMIEAYVDANGRVQDFRLLSDSDDAETILPQVKNLLIFTTFRPALSMGVPTAGTAVISFSKISVKG